MIMIDVHFMPTHFRSGTLSGHSGADGDFKPVCIIKTRRCQQVMVQQNKCPDNVPPNMWNTANNKSPTNPASEGPMRLSWELVTRAVR